MARVVWEQMNLVQPLKFHRKWFFFQKTPFFLSRREFSLFGQRFSFEGKSLTKKGKFPSRQEKRRFLEEKPFPMEFQRLNKVHLLPNHPCHGRSDHNVHFPSCHVSKNGAIWEA